MHGKSGPEYGIVIGREKATGRRFVANTAKDAATLMDLQEKEGLGRPGVVKSEAGRNLFTAM